MYDKNHKLIYSGTSGLVLPVPNKLFFPPGFRDKSRLTYYASLFNSLEVNSSFYKVPRASTVEKWADSVPDNFQFTFKLWKAVTHNKGLVFDPDDVRQFMQVIGHAGNKKGCLLLQFPASITIACAQRLTALLETVSHLDPGHQWKVAIEFRHPSWYEKDIYGLLHVRNINVVTHDMRPSAPSFIDSAAGWAYLRFHGPEKSYKGSYSDDFLKKYALTMNALNKEGKSVYVYFNNTLGDAVGDLIRLNGFFQNIQET